LVTTALPAASAATASSPRAPAISRAASGPIAGLPQEVQSVPSASFVVVSQVA
jgi:hypothetical protein